MVYGLGFRVQGLGFMITGLGFGAEGLACVTRHGAAAPTFPV
jgi:hypothetical protein